MVSRPVGLHDEPFVWPAEVRDQAAACEAQRLIDEGWVEAGRFYELEHGVLELAAGRDGVHPLVEGVETTRIHPPGHGVLVEPARLELIDIDDAELASGALGDQAIAPSLR